MSKVTLEELQANFKYDPSTGLITRTVQHGNYRAGTVCGGVRKRGYIVVCFKGMQYLAHRLVYMLQGLDVPDQIDHIDGNPSNNKWCNLRPSCPSTNQMNIGVHKRSSTGVKGIMLIRNGTLYRAEVCVNGKRYQKHSKDFDFLKEWVQTKRKELHGEFYRG